MVVDSFQFLPRLIATYYQSIDLPPAAPIPWTPLARPVRVSKFGLVTTAGLYLRDVQPPFDLERERWEPTWGDPTYRSIPLHAAREDLDISHLHFNSDGVLADFNIVLPLARMRELATAGEIRGVADTSFSFMGYQGYPPDTSAWRERYGPEVARSFLDQEIDCVLLTPA